jgi:hypothetical protein
MYSFVDYFTIPPSFVSIYLDRTWIGKHETRPETYRHFDFMLCFPFRSSFPSSAATYERSRYPPVLEYPQNLQFHSLGTISLDFYISMVNSGWNHSFGECPRHITRSRALISCSTQIYSWKIPATRWSSTIHINYRTGHVFTFSSSRCRPSDTVTCSARRCWDELSSYSSSSSDW